MIGLTRRQLLGGGVILGVGYLSAFAWGHRPHGTTTLAAAFEAVLPPDADVASLAAAVQSHVSGGDPVLAGQLAAGLLVLEHLGGAGPIGFSRFSRLTPEQRLSVLDSWRTSSITAKRQISDAVRKAALFSFYSQPSSWAVCGYDGPWVER